MKRIDVKGRVAALEVLVVTPAIANLIREAKTYQIPGMLQVGKKHGMQTLDDAIMDLFNKGMISPEDAYSRAIDKTKFRPLLKHPPEEWQ
jgi:twitching motility protein PilT